MLYNFVYLPALQTPPLLQSVFCLLFTLREGKINKIKQEQQQQPFKAYCVSICVYNQQLSFLNMNDRVVIGLSTYGFLQVILGKRIGTSLKFIRLLQQSDFRFFLSMNIALP